MKTINFLICLFAVILLPYKNCFAQNPAAPYVAPSYTNGCSWTGNQGALTNDLINNFYTTGGITNIQNYFSGCNSQQTPSNYTLYPPIPTKLLTVARGQQFKVHVGAGITFAQGFRVWVDWNQNNTYVNTPAPAGEMVYSTPNASVSTSLALADSVVLHSPLITVPLNAACGPTRMRVRGVFANTNFDPTSNYTYGETEEYWVVVVGNPAVTPPITNTIDTSICSGSDFTITAQASGTIQWFSELYLNTQLAAAPTNVVTSNSFTYLGLIRDTTMYVQNTEVSCKSARTQVRIQVEPIRTIDVTPADTNICASDTIVLTGIINPVAPIIKTYTSKAFTTAQVNSFANRIPDDYAGQHPNSFLINYISVDNVAPLILQPGSIVEVGVRITHNRLRDLDIWLIAPNNSQIQLSTDNGNTAINNNSNYGSGTGGAIQYCVFRDDATALVTAATTNSITGQKKPEQLLSTLTGSPNGTWALKIGDDEGPSGGTDTDNGRLLRWYIKFKRTASDTTVVWSPLTSLDYFTPGTTLNDTLKKFAFPSIDTKYYFDVYSLPGCRARDSATVNLNADLQLNVTSIPPQICIGGQATLTVSGIGGMDSTYWSPNNFGTYDSTYTVNPTDTTLYTVIAQNNHGCVDTTTFNLIVNPLPLPPVLTANGPTTFCFGGNVTLQSNQSAGNIWSTGQTTASVQYSASSPNITATYTDLNGCTSLSSLPTDVIVNALPTVPIINANGPLTFCQGNNVTLNAPTGFTYSWFHNGTAGYASTQSITVSAGNTYSVTITDANNCSSSSTNSTVVVNPLPATPTLSALGPISFCPGGNVTLQSTINVGYTWIPAAQNIQTNTVSTPGSYRVRVTDANGCTSAASNAIVVSYLPVPPTPIIINSGALNFCIGDSVTLTAPAGAATYFWNPSLQTSQSITVSVTGSYAVQLTNTSGCPSIFSAASDVVVNPLPAAPIINPLTPITICDGNLAILDAGNYASYQWSNGVTSNPLNIGVSGNYSVIVTDVNGCTSPTSLPISITVNPRPPTPNIIANGPTTFCVIDSVVLIASSTLTNPIYVWNPITGFYNNDSLTVNQTNNYNVTVIDGNGCSSFPSTNIPVTVNPLPPNPVITASSPTTFCEGDSVDLTVGPGNSFLWSNGSTSSTINVKVGNNYTVLVVDACALTHTPNMVVNVLNNPIADFSIDDTSGCTPLTINFTNTSQLANTYYWNFSTNQIITDMSPSHVFENPGQYTVKLIANSNNGCTDTKEYVKLISASNKPTLEFDYFPKPAFISTPFVQFEAITNGATSILWRCSDYNFTDTSYRTKLNLPDTGIHKMTLFAMNGDGCIDSLSYDVIVDGEFIMYMPNAFTPSTKDELNDLFKPTSLYLDKRHFNMTIYNRWGEKVFYTTNPEFGWNGDVKNTPVTGTFNWVIECLDTRGVRHTKSGSVTVIR